VAFNPAGTKWSVAALDDNGQVGDFHPTLWEFHNPSMNAGALWSGGYNPVPGCDDAYHCEILAAGSVVVSDAFDVFFVTPTRFVATKAGALYRFGKKA
jgi:hypothetical protein